MYLLTLAVILIRCTEVFFNLGKHILIFTYEAFWESADIQLRMCCPEGWIRFECSCYYKSTERKKWDESRTECLNRESDLVVIDSENEQVKWGRKVI
uniref:C-type lectin domain-containing protein n=1 Tax=Amphilophus citrinellus TaxID=61819 RepID=A0A3Q0S641_AMPCI